jgi:lipoprotein-releasing system permease protein
MGVGIEQSVAADVERGIYPLMLYVFRSGVPLSVMDPYQSFSTDRITGAGTFLIQQDIDQKYAITNLAFMKRMVNLPEDQYSSVEIALTDPEMEATVQANLSKLLGAGYKIESRYQQNKNLYAVMRMEKWAIYGILFLMLIVAAFTLIGSLSMLVMEKRKDIQILKALGASHTLIQGIFINEGFLLGVIGTSGGILLGLLVCWIQFKFQLIGIQGGTFLINAYPVKVRFFDLLIVASTVMGVCFIASWLPSRRAVKYDKD